MKLTRKELNILAAALDHYLKTYAMTKHELDYIALLANKIVNEAGAA